MLGGPLSTHAETDTLMSAFTFVDYCRGIGSWNGATVQHTLVAVCGGWEER